MKTGRNDPCPCGSGKKYKKCCFEIDRTNMFDELYPPEGEQWEPEEETFFDDNDEFDEDDFEDDENFDEDDLDYDDEDDLDSVFSFDENTELPKLSDEEMQLVDNWWDKYKKMKDTVKERKHLVAFINQYPHLVDYLELYHEVLFELGSDHLKKGIYDIFVELLLRIRKEYPYTYKKCYKYYDSDLIYWYVAQGRFDEIDTFFNYFREDKKFSEHLEDLMMFFHSINRPDILLKLLAGTMHTDHISFIKINNIIQKYIDRPVTDKLVQLILQEHAPEHVGDDVYNVKIVKENMLNYTRPFVAWDTNLLRKRSQALDYYRKISLNFAYYLYKNTDLSLISAVVNSKNIGNYYYRVVYNNNNLPVDTFCLDEKSILKNSLNYNDSIFWGYEMGCFIELNVLYHFAAYLNVCGNISEEKKKELQEMITNLYQGAFKISKDKGPEMLMYKQFPLWVKK